MTDSEEANSEQDSKNKQIKEGMDEAIRMGVPTDILRALSEGHPAFQVVAAHAIWEGMVKDAVVSLLSALSFDDAYDRDRLTKFVSRLPINGRTGALELLSCIYDVPEQFRAHLKRLSWLRNRFAHTHENLHKSYVKMYMELPEADRRQFLLDFLPIEPEGIPKEPEEKLVEEMMRGSTSLSLFRFIFFCKSLKEFAKKTEATRKEKLKE